MRIVLIALTLTACAPPRNEPAARPAPTAAPQAHVSAPATATLESLQVTRGAASAPGGLAGAPAPTAAITEASLLARVSLNASADLPVTVTLSLPPGVTLRAGRGRFIVPAVRPGVVIEERYILAYTAAPAEPVVLRAHAAGEDFGFHAEARWRFDRPESAPPRVAADGARFVLGRHDFGPSVRVPR